VVFKISKGVTLFGRVEEVVRLNKNAAVSAASPQYVRGSCAAVSMASAKNSLHFSILQVERK
jgi:hypothetical protein